MNEMKEIFIIALIANIGEFLLGWAIKLITGDFLWIYPNSVLVTSSVYAFPVWVIGIFLTMRIVNQLTKRRKR